MPNISDRELSRLKSSVSELSVLNRIANAINVTMSVDDISRIIVENCLKHVGASQGGIFLLKTRESGSKEFATFVRHIDSGAGEIPFHVSESLKGWIIKNKQIILTNAPDQDDRFPGMDFKALGMRSILAAPLLSRHGLIGALAVVNKNAPEGFDEQDRRFIGIVATQTAKVIENAQLFEKEKRLVLIDEEMKLANSIQKGFLPGANLSIPGCEIYGFNQPAREMGGDYYDMVKLDGQRVFVSLGDVSGKGIPAALQMANAQAVLRSQLSRKREIVLTDMAENLNRLICQFTPPEQYITALFGVYDGSRRVLAYINAGHLPPLVITSDGNLVSPGDADLVIGVLPDNAYNIYELRLERQDTVFLYTDGITEAFNDKDEEFGEERLRQVLVRDRQLDVAALGEKVYREVSDHRGRRDQSDDITMLILRVM